MWIKYFRDQSTRGFLGRMIGDGFFELMFTCSAVLRHNTSHCFIRQTVRSSTRGTWQSWIIVKWKMCNFLSLMCNEFSDCEKFYLVLSYFYFVLETQIKICWVWNLQVTFISDLVKLLPKLLFNVMKVTKNFWFFQYCKSNFSSCIS